LIGSNVSALRPIAVVLADSWQERLAFVRKGFAISLDIFFCS
jgi:hypothetical protein